MRTYPIKSHSKRQIFVRNLTELIVIWANRPLIKFKLLIRIHHFSEGNDPYKKLSFEDSLNIIFILTKFKLHFIFGAIHKVRTQVGGGEFMTKAYGGVQGGGGSNVISTYAFRLYIFHFSRFSRKEKKYEND